MNQKKNRPKNLLNIVLGFAVISTIGFSAFNYNLGQGQKGLYNLSSGLNVCFQRVAQTFTALMINDFSSYYLQKSFKETTSQCFNEVGKTSQLAIVNSAVFSKTFENFQSDLHWFNRKITKLEPIAQSGESDLSQSNISTKFESLEELKDKMDISISSKLSSSDQIGNLSFAGIIASQLILVLALCSLFLGRKRREMELGVVETKARELNGDNSIDEDFIITSLDKLANVTHAKSTMGRLRKQFESLVKDNERLNESLMHASTIGHEVSVDELLEEFIPVVKKSELNETLQSDIRSVSDFSSAINIVLDRVQEKALVHGVLIDTDLNDSFSVYSSQEILEQLLYTTIQYSIEGAREEAPRKISMRSKPLGGVSYCKIRLSAHQFSESDFALFNGRESSATDSDINLILLKELLADANAKVAIRNLTNSGSGVSESEIELIFERSSQVIETLEQRPAVVKVLKGNKQQMKEMLGQSL